MNPKNEIDQAIMTTLTRFCKESDQRLTALEENLRAASEMRSDDDLELSSQLVQLSNQVSQLSLTQNQLAERYTKLTLQFEEFMCDTRSMMNRMSSRLHDLEGGDLV